MSYKFIKIPKMELNNNIEIPVIGLGTRRTIIEEVANAIRKALRIGYRYFDCAPINMNEKEIGQTLKAEMDRNVVKRSDLFITSKLWNTFHTPNCVELALKKSLENLQTSYVDLYLIHWPIAYKAGDKMIPLNNKGEVIHSNVKFVETWKAMEKLVSKKLTNSIGVCNFNITQIETLIKSATIRPVVNQVECHPFLNQENLRQVCHKHNILIVCNNPLGAPKGYVPKLNEPMLLDSPVLFKLARKYRKTPIQIALKYQLQRKNIVVPKTMDIYRLFANINVFDFEINENDMKLINDLNLNKRYVQVVVHNDVMHPDYPFKDPE